MRKAIADENIENTHIIIDEQYGPDGPVFLAVLVRSTRVTVVTTRRGSR